MLGLGEGALPERPSTGEQVANLLQDAIMSGLMRRGTPLREEQIAGQFEVSRRSARDALRVLESQGLVRYRRNKGSAVTNFTVDDVRDIYQTRKVLELAAAGNCAVERKECIPPIRFEALKAALGRLAQACQLGDTRAMVEADVSFHAAVVGLLDRTRLDSFFAGLAVEMRYAIAIIELEQHEAIYRPREAFVEHEAIYKALVSGDAATAQTLIEEHIDSNCNRLVAIVSTQ